MPHAALQLADKELLAECEVHTYRASGPGGQKRNKIESAVRIRHLPTGVAAVAEESRSQSENRRRALSRLRERIATNVRTPVDLENFQPAVESWLSRGGSGGTGRIAISNRHRDYPHAIATMLDFLAACGGRVSDAARHLGCWTHQFTSFLAKHPRAWQAANRIRQQCGQRPLRVS